MADIVGNFGDVFKAFNLFLPLIVCCFILSAAIGFFVAEGESRQSAMLQLFYTAIVGSGVAYIEVELSKDFIKAVLPSAITVLIVLFQLIGRMRPDFKPPFNTQLAYSAAALGIIAFIVSAQYFKVAIESSQL